MEPNCEKIEECQNMELKREEIDSQSTDMTTNETADDVSVSIDDELSCLSPPPPERCICRVHDHLRKVNEKAYEPDIVAIGPYHRDNKNLKMIEEHKLRYLKSLLMRKEKKSEFYLAAMRSLVDRARKLYAEDLKRLTDNEFAKMMLLDGCFIIELFRKCYECHLRDKNDPIFEVPWILSSLQRDLMLFENQIPFFVLCKLFDMIEGPDKHHRLIHLALLFFFDLVPRLFPGLVYISSDVGDSSDKIPHLLGLIHINWLPSFAGKESNENSADNKVNWRFNCLPSFAGRKSNENFADNKVNRRFNCLRLFAREETIEKRRFIYCATGLSEAGVKFEKIKKGSLSDIKFERGKLQIPPLIVEDATESFLRNMMAYEQYCPARSIMFVTDYVNFLDCLINTSKDVEILSRSGIIDNWLGDDEVVANLINKTLDSITLCPSSKYAKIFEQVNFYCSKQCNKWMAKLRRNYLNTPWGVIPILAASVLLLLTVTQTVFTIIPRKQ